MAIDVTRWRSVWLMYNILNNFLSLFNKLSVKDVNYMNIHHSVAATTMFSYWMLGIIYLVGNIDLINWKTLFTWTCPIQIHTCAVLKESNVQEISTLNEKKAKNIESILLSSPQAVAFPNEAKYFFWLWCIMT